MATQIHSHRITGKSYTPLVALQIFSGALIASVVLMTILLFVLKTMDGWEASTLHIIAYSPLYAIAMAGACLVLSFLVPEFLLDSVRRELKTHTPNRQTEDTPFILVPCIFIRYALLACVTMIGFVMAVSGSSYSVFLPFTLVSLILMAVYFPTESRMRDWLQET